MIEQTACSGALFLFGELVPKSNPIGLGKIVVQNITPGSVYFFYKAAFFESAQRYKNYLLPKAAFGPSFGACLTSDSAGL